DLSAGHQRLACSALAQVYQQVGTQTPDVDDPDLLRRGFEAIQSLVSQDLLLAYHDRSDGGLIVSLLEMAFAGRCGLDVSLNDKATLATLFNEELGAVLQVSKQQLAEVKKIFSDFELIDCVTEVAQPTIGQTIKINRLGNEIYSASRVDLHRTWSATTYQMQSMRDNPDCAQQEYDRLLDTADTGLFSDLSFDPKDDVSAPYIGGKKPKLAILREQGVNSHIEMAAAFTQAGFSAIDVTMTDIIDGRTSLQDYQGLIACGGFSYGDVLGAGEGWAKSILFNQQVSDRFSAFFDRQDTFSLGICNGCQMMSNLKSIIPGAEHWPRFVRNLSEQYEARVTQTEIADSNSILLAGMQSSKFPIVVAHGEGRAEFGSAQALNDAERLVALRYIDYAGRTADKYPANPNGSPNGIAGLTNADGRITILMPHPERVFRAATNSWRDESWGDYSPWMRMFRNARVWVD
nr:phosphoribosylformylglycinamidine synthase subunit PurQ [Acidiferrobacterales bacterium]